MIITVTPLVVCIIGLLMYCLAANGKVAEIGRVLFLCGFLVCLLGLGKAGGFRL